MRSFTFYTPTKVFFGEDAESHIGPALKAYGAKKVLIHYGSDRIKKTGLFDKVTDQLRSVGIDYVELGGVEPNPKISMVRRGIELVKKEGVDFILGIGGGSVSDSAKGIRLGLSLDMDPWEALVSGKVAEHPFPMGLVLTISAAGSEMSNSLVLSNEELHLKRGANNDGNRMEFAFMNPANTLTTPPFQTAAGVTDIMMHTMERYCTNEPATPLTDALAIAILKTVKEYGKRVYEHPDDLEARGEIMWASTVSHNNLTELGRAKRTFTGHRIEHDISGVHDNVTHGAGLATVFPAWCLYEAPCDYGRFASLMREVWDAKSTDDAEAVKEGVANMRAFYKSIGMPTTMSELGVDPSEYEYISGLTTNGGANPIPSFRGVLTQEDIINIYKLAE